MGKLQGFPERLQAFTTGRRLMPYEWGVNDCVLFAADAWLAITEVDPISEYRDKMWTNEAEARATIEAEGGLIEACDKRFTRVDVNYAQRGDICLVKDANGQPSLAVLVTPGYCAAPGPEMMLLIPMDEARLAWTA